MKTEELLERIDKIMEPFLAEMNMELIDLHIKRQFDNVHIEVLADKLGGGITLDECAFLNSKIVEVIDREQFLGDQYTLEVSSPGLDRPLKTKKDFLRVLSRPVHLFLTEPVNKKWEYEGIINEVKESSLLVNTKNQQIEIPLNVIMKGKQII